MRWVCQLRRLSVVTDLVNRCEHPTKILLRIRVLDSTVRPRLVSPCRHSFNSPASSRPDTDRLQISPKAFYCELAAKKLPLQPIRIGAPLPVPCRDVEHAVAGRKHAARASATRALRPSRADGRPAARTARRRPDTYRVRGESEVRAGADKRGGRRPASRRVPC